MGSPHPNRSYVTTMTTLSVTPVKRPSTTPKPAFRLTPLTDIDPYSATAVRSTQRVTDVPDLRANRTVPFNSSF